MLLILLNIDRVKLILINFIKGIYIYIYDLRDLEYMYGRNKRYTLVLNCIEWLLKCIVVNPILLILHKFYYALHVLQGASLKDLFINSFFGVIISVLIFTPAISYLLLNYN